LSVRDPHRYDGGNRWGYRLFDHDYKAEWMKDRKTMISILLTLLFFAILFKSYNTGANLDDVLRRSGIRLATMLVVGVSVAYSSIIFQTITNNKILTPAIMGYESIFILFQTVLVLIYGDQSFRIISQETNFLYAVILMLAFSVLMYTL